MKWLFLSNLLQPSSPLHLIRRLQHRLFSTLFCLVPLDTLARHCSIYSTVNDSHITLLCAVAIIAVSFLRSILRRWVLELAIPSAPRTLPFPLAVTLLARVTTETTSNHRPLSVPISPPPLPLPLDYLFFQASTTTLTTQTRIPIPIHLTATRLHRSGQRIV